MFRHLLRRRARRSRTSLIPPHLQHHRDHVDRQRPWRRTLTWAALITLIASALYFSVTDRGDPKTPATSAH
jgi:hypothetical protein